MEIAESAPRLFPKVVVCAITTLGPSLAALVIIHDLPPVPVDFGGDGELISELGTHSLPYNSQAFFRDPFCVLTLATRLGSTTAWLPSLLTKPQIENEPILSLGSHLTSPAYHGSVFLESAGSRYCWPLANAEALLCTAGFIH